MSKLHQSTSWQMLDRTARRLRLDAVTRLQARQDGWLTVQEGRVWITRDGGGLDHVLQAGERFWLREGEGLVVEPWRRGELGCLGWQLPAAASAQRLAPRPRAEAGFSGAAWSALARALRGAAERLLAAARSADAMASRAHGSIRAGDSMASCGAAQ
jgi:hypothetical protein